jgi:deazaflavin-dependent oxidoreductase (nitroreductase family)
MTDAHQKAPWLPPRWFVRLFWRAHRGVYRVTRGHVGLWRPRGDRWGTLRLTATGRRSGAQRTVLLGYVQDGPRLVTLAMNGWAQGEPAWWLNVQADPDVTIDTGDGPRPARVHGAQGDERARLWARWQEVDKKLDGYAARRPSETAVVVIEPQPVP